MSSAPVPGVPGGGALRTALRRRLAVVLGSTALLWITATVILQGLHGTVQSVRGSTSPAYLDVIKAHAALSDADRAAWQSFRSGEAEFTGPGLQFQDDITNVSQEFQQLAVLSGSAGSQQLQTVSGQLVNYQALVEQADAAYRADTVMGTARGHKLGVRLPDLRLALAARSGRLAVCYR
jgi:hypothetical protein